MLTEKVKHLRLNIYQLCFTWLPCYGRRVKRNVVRQIRVSLVKFIREFLTRIVLGFFGIILIFIGVSSIYNGILNYSNYWGGIVFAPVAIIMGVLVLVIVTFRWKALHQKSNNKNSNKYKTRKHDDWRKW